MSVEAPLTFDYMESTTEGEAGLIQGIAAQPRFSGIVVNVLPPGQAYPIVDMWQGQAVIGLRTVPPGRSLVRITSTLPVEEVNRFWEVLQRARTSDRLPENGRR